MRNCRTMAVFLGPRHTTAEEREGRRKPKDITWSEPILSPSLFGVASVAAPLGPLELGVAPLELGVVELGSAFGRGGV